MPTTEPITYSARWWSNRPATELLDASGVLNKVAWRGHPAGTLMIQINATSRGRMWEVHATFISRREGWSVRIQEGQVAVYDKRRFAEIVPRTAKLRIAE